MIQMENSGCQVVIYPGYAEFSHPISRQGQWEQNPKAKNKKWWQQDLNTFVYKRSLEKLDNAGDTKTGNKKAITQFSSSSRKRLLKKLYSFSELPTHLITLTYPKYYPADSKEWKRHLDNFRRVLLIIIQRHGLSGNWNPKNEVLHIIIY